MTQECLASGEKVHIITRRIFADDLRRHFVGLCTHVNDNHARVEGYAFVFDASRNEYQRKPELRTRVFSLVGAGLIITVLPGEVDVAALKYSVSNGRLVLTDAGSFELDINEFGVKS